ncbi:MAG: SDR family oxidoreductase, partial [Armatimonadetes bacterium]|nr:SDR family oxidoreductase [Armatimonadota bacterium]
VTGGGSGIGRATVLKLSGLGAKVAIVDINEEAANKVADELKENDNDVLVVKTDISDYEQVQVMANTVNDHFRRIDVLINNAGFDKIMPFMDTTPDLWYRLIDVILKGSIHVTRAVLEFMIKQETGGAIVNVTSDAAKVGSSGEAAYSAAKGGVYSFTKSLAKEMARYKIRVNSTCPGPTDTPLMDDIKKGMPKVIEAIEKSIPMRKMASPEQQANAIVWLASDEASYITGQALSVNGGLSMC